MDYALFAQHRAIDRNVVIQVVWVYDQAVDFDGLRLFSRNLGYGLLGRRIERSRLPFARHRWVLDHSPPDIDIAASARPRAEVSDWADEHSRLPTDPERGPGWRIGVLPLEDGANAVSLVLSHYLIDGFGLAVTIVNAAMGRTRDLDYPPPRSLTRLRAVAQDVRQVTRDMPQVARAVAAGARLARRNRQDNAKSSASRPAPVEVADGDEVIAVPVITMHIDLDDWDNRAKALGGTSDTLVAGLAAKLGQLLGRQRASDGAVTLQLPISERTADDTRAIAVSYARLNVDPTNVTTDLRDVRAAVKQALADLREQPDEFLQLLPLAPFTPRRALKRMGDAMVADPDHPVFCSNLGDLGLLLYALANDDDEYAIVSGILVPLQLIRVVGQNVTRQWYEQAGGQLNVQSWRIGGKVSITVDAYQPNGENTKQSLREITARALAEFDLSGDVY